jgi:hypothetical protein
MKKILNFEKRVNEALKDPIMELAKEFAREGFTELDITENLGRYPCIPDPEKCHLRNCIRDIERISKE